MKFERNEERSKNIIHQITNDNGYKTKNLLKLENKISSILKYTKKIIQSYPQHHQHMQQQYSNQKIIQSIQKCKHKKHFKDRFIQYRNAFIRYVSPI